MKHVDAVEQFYETLSLRALRVDPTCGVIDPSLILRFLLFKCSCTLSRFSIADNFSHYVSTYHGTNSHDSYYIFRLYVVAQIVNLVIIVIMKSFGTNFFVISVVFSNYDHRRFSTDTIAKTRQAENLDDRSSTCAVRTPFN